MPASAASRIASAAPAAGTKIIVASAPVFATASATVLKAGSDFPDSLPIHDVPPFLGVTPPTNWVPYLRHWSVWKPPTEPVIPWQRTRVDLLTRILIQVNPSGEALESRPPGMRQEGCWIGKGDCDARPLLSNRRRRIGPDHRRCSRCQRRWPSAECRPRRRIGLTRSQVSPKLGSAASDRDQRGG